MKYTPYESPFVREARITALERAKSAQKLIRKNSRTGFASADPPSPREALSNKPSNSGHMNTTPHKTGLFDPSLKKVEIFQIHPRGGAGRERTVGTKLEEGEEEGRRDMTKENSSTRMNNRAVVREYEGARLRQGRATKEPAPALQRRRHYSSSRTSVPSRRGVYMPMFHTGNKWADQAQRKDIGIELKEEWGVAPTEERSGNSSPTQASHIQLRPTTIDAANEEKKHRGSAEEMSAPVPSQLSSSTSPRKHDHNMHEQRAHTLSANSAAAHCNSGDSSSRKILSRQQAMHNQHAERGQTHRLMSTLGSSAMQQMQQPYSSAVSMDKCHVSRSTSPLNDKSLRALQLLQSGPCDNLDSGLQDFQRQQRLHFDPGGSGGSNHDWHSKSRNVTSKSSALTDRATSPGRGVLPCQHHTPADQALVQALSHIIDSQDKLHLETTERLLQSLPFFSPQHVDIDTRKHHNSCNGVLRSVRDGHRNELSHAQGKSKGAKKAVRRDYVDFKAQKRLTSQILEKLQALDDKEKRIVGLLSEPPVDPILPISRRQISQHSPHGREPHDTKVTNAVSIPSNRNVHLDNNAATCHRATSVTIATTASNCSSAPAVHDTFEVTTCWGDLDEGVLNLTNSEEKSCPESADDLGDTYTGARGGGQGQLLQCSPGNREEILQYRKELQRINAVRAVPFCHNSNSLTFEDVAEKLTSIILNGVMDDVTQELDFLFTDIATKVVGKI